MRGDDDPHLSVMILLKRVVVVVLLLLLLLLLLLFGGTQNLSELFSRTFFFGGKEGVGFRVCVY